LVFGAGAVFSALARSRLSSHCCGIAATFCTA